VIIYVDIDETICITPASRDYSEAIPRRSQIAKINRLHDEGHTIVYWTARGNTTATDYEELTLTQLTDWGVKYHRLETKHKKPQYDVLIDDRTMRIEEV